MSYFPRHSVSRVVRSLSWRGRVLLATGSVATLAGGFIAVAASSNAASAACQVAVGCKSFDSPIHGGMDLDAQNWGVNIQTGTAFNDPITVWGESMAGRAADFVQVPVASTAVPAGDTTKASTAGATSGPFLLEFDPKGVPSGFCISAISDTNGTYARLRNCAMPSTVAGATTSTFNQWQSFWEVPQGDGFFQLGTFGEPITKYLNIKGFGGDATPVISYDSTGTAENQIWETNG